MYEKLIDDYINEVTKNMGTRQRMDVDRELRTHIMDSADALAAERKTNVDEFIIREVLARMGPARQVAAMYPTPKTFLEMKEVKDMWKAMQALIGIAVVFVIFGIILLVLAPGTLEISAVEIAFQVVFALGIAATVLGAILFAMYLYETRFKTYEDRLKRLEKSLSDADSPLKVGMAIFGTLVWLIVLNLFWTKLPFVSSFESDATLIPVLSSGFAHFVLWFNVLAVIGIGIQLLFLVMKQKWVPALLEAIMGIGMALMFAWILAEMPFNPALPGGVFTGIKIFLAFIIAITLFDVGKKLWNTGRLFLHEKQGNGSTA
jgi:putative flippase GtrA